MIQHSAPPGKKRMAATYWMPAFAGHDDVDEKIRRRQNLRRMAVVARGAVAL